MALANMQLIASYSPILWEAQQQDNLILRTTPYGVRGTKRQNPSLVAIQRLFLPKRIRLRNYSLALTEA